MVDERGTPIPARGIADVRREKFHHVAATPAGVTRILLPEPRERVRHPQKRCFRQRRPVRAFYKGADSDWRTVTLLFHLGRELEIRGSLAEQSRLGTKKLQGPARKLLRL